MRRSKPDAGELDAPACRRIAIELLARREHSRRELTRKLSSRGFPEDVIAGVLDELEQSGELADARFTDTFVRSRVAKGRGPQRIRAELAQRGIGDSAADEVLRGAEVDWLETVRAVRCKRFGAELPRDYAERARQARFLQYRGFSSEQIRAALELDADSD
ncbi:MAG TPA: regulatory protein RecX [Gammaproteobacteria bacterium]|nr:regulatory protein RecX [Gammaproteobacteria bacterium]